MAALAPLSIPFPEIENPTDFSRLSQQAQDAIVGAMVGEYESGPPELAESVKDEIRAWAGIPSDNAELRRDAAPPMDTDHSELHED